MSLLFRYISFEFTKFFVLLLFAFTVIILVGNLFSRLGDAFSSISEFLRFLKETALLLPILFELVVPITVLLATIATFNSLSRTSEIVAMRAAGMGMWKLAKPVLGVSLIIAALSYLNQNYLYRNLNQIWGDPTTTHALPPIWKVNDNEIFYFGPRSANMEVDQISIFRWAASPYQLIQRDSIVSGALRDDEWELSEMQQRTFQEGQLKVSTQTEQKASIAELPSVSFQQPTNPHHEPLERLYETIQKMESEGQDVTQHRVEWHQKWANSFTIFIMVLIGLGLSVSHARHSKAAESMAISVLLGVVFWIANQIFLAMGSAGGIPPILAAWAANVIFCFISIFLAYRYRV